MFGDSAHAGTADAEAFVEQARRKVADQLHGGRVVARRLRAAGVSKLFTLSSHQWGQRDGGRERQRLADARPRGKGSGRALRGRGRCRRSTTSH